MWKRSTTVDIQNLVELRGLLQEITEWETSHTLGRKIFNTPGPWENTDRDTVLEQGYEASGLPPQACCPRCANKKPVIVSGIRELTDSDIQDPPLQERYLDCFCPVCWSFQNCRHNKDEVKDWSFLRSALSNSKITDPVLLTKGLKDPVKDLRPDGLAFRLPTETKAGTLCILEFKRMSDVTDQYLIRARSRAEDQYASLKRALGATLQHQGWQVEQISFIAGSWSLNEQDLRKNLKFL